MFRMRTGRSGQAGALAAALPAARDWPGTAFRVPVPAAAQRVHRWLGTHVTDGQCIAAIAIALSVGAYLWYSAHGLRDAFNDAQIRELIARRVVASRTPGLAQLGVTWLPLNSILMLPLIWNDALFRSGLASSLPSMAAFVIGTLYMYRIGLLVTSTRAGRVLLPGIL